MSVPNPKQIADFFYANGMACNCDLDNWEPTKVTGHSHVCRIHKSAVDPANASRPGLLQEVEKHAAGGAA